MGEFKDIYYKDDWEGLAYHRDTNGKITGKGMGRGDLPPPEPGNRSECKVRIGGVPMTKEEYDRYGDPATLTAYNKKEGIS